MKSLIVSAHNPMTGPRHLGHYVSTMAEWPQLAREHELIIIIDDLIAAILYPASKSMLQQRTLQTAREFMAMGLDLEANHIVLTSMLPEAHELAALASMGFEHAWFERLYAESFAGLLTSYQRRELGLPRLPTIAEFVHPQLHLAALTMGLRADFFQGGEEMKGYLPLLGHLAEHAYAHGLYMRNPAFLPGRSTFLIGIDGQHMASDNAIYLAAPPEQIKQQLERVESIDVLRQLMTAVDPNTKIDFGPNAKLEVARRQVLAALVELLRPFREYEIETAQLGARLEQSAAIVGERLRASLIEIKTAMKLPGYNFGAAC